MHSRSLYRGSLRARCNCVNRGAGERCRLASRCNDPPRTMTAANAGARTGTGSLPAMSIFHRRRGSMDCFALGKDLDADEEPPPPPSSAADKPRSGLAVGWSAGFYIMPSSKRKTIRMANGLHSEVHVQIGPIEVTRSWFLHVWNFPHGNIFEPWEIPTGEENFLFAGEQPDAVRRNARNFNFRSADAQPLGTHSDAPPLSLLLPSVGDGTVHNSLRVQSLAPTRT